MLDVDSIQIARGDVTQMALALEIAVMASETFAAEYLAIYGREWESLDISNTGKIVSASTVATTNA